MGTGPTGATDRQACEAAEIKYRMNRRGTAHHPISERWRQINRARSSVRARGAFAFQVVKCQWKYTKVRYRGLAKNTAQIFTLVAPNPETTDLRHERVRPTLSRLPSSP